MKQVIFEFNELSDSVEFYNRKPRKYIYFFIIMSIIIIISAVVWASIAKKEEVINLHGSIKSDEIRQISTVVNGKVMQCNVDEGKEVKKDELLIVIEHNQQLSDKNYLEKQLEVLNEVSSTIDKAIDSLNAGKNLLTKGSSLYYKVDTYFVQYNQLSMNVITPEDKQKSEASQQSMKSGFMAELQEQKNNTQKEIDKDNSDLEKTNGQIKDSYIYAPCDGIVNLNAEVKVDSVVQAGQVLFIISNSNAKDWKAEVNIPSNNILNIKLGDKAKIMVPGLSQADYGFIEGEITSIENNARVDDKTKESFYNAMISIKKPYLEGNNVPNKELKMGLRVEAKVIECDKTILKYILQKINLWLR